MISIRINFKSVSHAQSVFSFYFLALHGFLCPLAAQETWFFETDSTSIRIEANGTFSVPGEFEGMPLKIESDGLIRFDAPEDEQDPGNNRFEWRVNTGLDLMLGVVSKPDRALMRWLVRKPATLTPAHLVGQWKLLGTELDHGELGPLRHGFFAVDETLFFSGNGRWNVGGEQGTWSLSEGRHAILKIESDTYVFSVNASRDVLICTSQITESEHVLFLLIKQDPNPTSSVFGGDWTYGDLQIDIAPPDLAHLADWQVISIDPSGRFNRRGSDFQWGVSAGAPVLMESFESVDYVLNQGKNLLVSSVEEEDQIDLTVFLKTRSNYSASDIAGDWTFHEIGIRSSTIMGNQAERFSEDGRVIERFEFLFNENRQRVYNGLSTHFNPDSRLKTAEREYENGQLNGWSREFDSQGRVTREERYASDMIQQRNTFNFQQRLILEEVFTDGQIHLSTRSDWGLDRVRQKSVSSYLEGEVVREVTESFRDDGTLWNLKEVDLKSGKPVKRTEKSYAADGLRVSQEFEESLNDIGVVLHRDRKSYREDGTLWVQTEESFENGEKVRQVRRTYETDGQTLISQFEETYGPGNRVLSEARLTFTSQGQLIRETSLVYHPIRNTLVEHGLQKTLDPSGRLLSQSESDMGRLKSRETISYWDAGTKRDQRLVRIVNGAEIIESAHWHENGLLSSQGSTYNRQNHGWHRRYNPEGELIEEVHWAYGVLDGPSRVWNTNGTRSEEVYASGVLIGSQRWDETERLLHSRFWEDGLPIGTWILLNIDSTGETLRETEYRNGVVEVETSTRTQSIPGRPVNRRVDRRFPPSVLEETYLADGTRVARSYRIGGYFGVLDGEYEEAAFGGADADYVYQGPHVRAFYKDGRLEGRYERYFYGGHHLEILEHYKDGLLDGERKLYLEDGTLRWSEVYQNGELHGSREIFFEDGDAKGRLNNREGFQSGLKSGVSEVFNRDGALVKRFEYLNDLYHGWVREYDQPGAILRRQTHYRNGLQDGMDAYYDSNGNPVSESEWLTGFRHGTTREWDLNNGLLKSLVEYQNGIRHGKSQDYFEGRLVDETTYTRDLETGPRLIYNANNDEKKLWQRYPLLNGMVHGTFEQFFDNGQLNMATEYVRGVKHGSHKNYAILHNANGQTYHIYETGAFSDGKPCGNWQRFNASGIVTSNTAYDSCGDEPLPSLNGLTGVVVRADTLQPLVNARIEVLDLGGKVVASSSTTAGGFFRLIFPSDLPSGLVIQVSQDGFATNQESLDVSLHQPGFHPYHAQLMPDNKADDIASVESYLQGGFFLEKIKLDNWYEVQLAEPKPSLSLFYNAGKGDHYAGSITQSTSIGYFNVGHEIAPGVSSIQFFTKDANQWSGHPFAVPARSFPVPSWSKLLGTWVPSVGEDKRGQYRLSNRWPEVPISIVISQRVLPPQWWDKWKKLPWVGQFKEFGFKDLQIELDAIAYTDGSGEVFAGGQATVDVGEFSLTPKIAGAGLVNWGKTLTLEKFQVGGGLEAQFSKDFSLTNILSQFNDTKSWHLAEEIPIAGDYIEILTRAFEIKSLIGVNGAFTLELDTNDQGIEIAGGEFSLKTGARNEINSYFFDMMHVNTLFSFEYGWNASGPSLDEIQHQFTAEVEASFYVQILDYTNVVSSKETIQYPENPELLSLPIEPVEPKRFSLYIPPVQDARRLQNFSDNAPIKDDPSGTTQVKILESGVYPLTRTAIASQGSITAMAWVHYEPNRPAGQETDIHYAIQDGEDVSEPLAIRSDTRADFNPSLAFASDGTLIAVWEACADPDFTGTTLLERLAATEIAWAAYDPTTAAWSEGGLLTHNDHFDFNPRLIRSPQGEVLLTWQSNTGNQLMGNTSHPTQIWISKWNGSGFSTPTPVTDGLQMAWSPSLAYDDQVLMLVYVVDRDGVASTSEDWDLAVRTFLDEQWSAPEFITRDEVRDDQPRLLSTGPGRFELFWKKDNDLVRMKDWNDAVHEVVVPSITTEVSLVHHDKGKIVVAWAGQDGSNPEMFGRLFQVADNPGLDEGAWSEVLSFARGTGISSAYSLSISGEELRMLFVDHRASNPLPDLVYRRTRLGVDVGLEWAELIDQESPAQSGGNLRVEVQLKNSGFEQGESVKLEFFLDHPDRGGTRLYELPLNQPLKAGEVRQLNAVLRIPSFNPEQMLWIRAVLGAGQVDLVPENNWRSLALLNADPAVLSFSWSNRDPSQLQLVGRLGNLGGKRSETFTVKLHGPNGVLHQEQIASILPGEVVGLNRFLPLQEAFLDEVGIFSLSIDTTPSGDSNDGNNVKSLALTRPPSPGQAPVLNFLSNKKVAVGERLEFRIEAEDDGLPAGILYFRKVKGPESLELTPDGLLYFFPTLNDVGQTYRVEIQVSDGLQGANGSFDITVEAHDQSGPFLMAGPISEDTFSLQIVGNAGARFMLESVGFLGAIWMEIGEFQTKGMDQPIDLSLPNTSRMQFFRLRSL